MKLRNYIFTMVLALTQFSVLAQDSRVDFFVGADLHLRDITWDHLYDVQLQLTPGMKWNMGKGWKTALQMKAAVVNYGYPDGEWVPQLGVAAISKEFNWDKFDMKVSGGNFSNCRYGLDWKGRYYLNDWFALDGQLGLTGFMTTVDGWKATKMKTVTGSFGGNVYLRRWNTQISMRAGRFIHKDWGGLIEAYRHFNHCSVGLYAQLSNYGKDESDYKIYNGGFTVVMMIPPYSFKKAKKVRFRPASNFMLKYNLRGVGGCREYDTDPEQNPRNGWFDRTAKQWEQ